MGGMTAKDLWEIRVNFGTAMNIIGYKLKP